MPEDPEDPRKEKPLHELGLDDLDPRLREAFEASYAKNRELLEELAKL